MLQTKIKLPTQVSISDHLKLFPRISGDKHTLSFHHVLSYQRQNGGQTDGRVDVSPHLVLSIKCCISPIELLKEQISYQIFGNQIFDHAQV